MEWTEELYVPAFRSVPGFQLREHGEICRDSQRFYLVFLLWFEDFSGVPVLMPIAETLDLQSMIRNHFQHTVLSDFTWKFLQIMCLEIRSLGAMRSQSQKAAFFTTHPSCGTTKLLEWRIWGIRTGLLHIVSWVFPACILDVFPSLHGLVTVFSNAATRLLSLNFWSVSSHALRAFGRLGNIRISSAASRTTSRHERRSWIL